MRLVNENNDKSGRGGLSAVARIAGVGRSTLENIIQKKVIVGQYRDGKKFYQMGEATARKIEEAFGMPMFALDHPPKSLALEKAVETEAQRKLLLAVMSRLDSFVFSDADCDKERERLDRLYPLPDDYDLCMEEDVRKEVFRVVA